MRKQRHVREEGRFNFLCLRLFVSNEEDLFHGGRNRSEDRNNASFDIPLSFWSGIPLKYRCSPKIRGDERVFILCTYRECCGKLSSHRCPCRRRSLDRVSSLCDDYAFFLCRHACVSMRTP